MMLNSDLYEVQRKALENAREADGSVKPGYAWFMEMGLGKTRTDLYETYWLMKAGKLDIELILCPRSLRGTWRGEAEAIGFPYPVLLMDGSADSMWKSIVDVSEGKSGKKVVVVCHYDLVLTRCGDLIELMLEKGVRLKVTLDESTRIKNPQAKVGKYLIQLRNKFAYKRILSGSPAPQGTHDLWGQFKFIGATDQKYFAFRNTYCTMGGWMGKQITGSQNLDILKMRTKDFVFRAKKKDWTDLPDKLFPQPREIEMTKPQREAYLQMMHDFVLEWGDQEITAKMAVTAKTKLQQIGSGFLYNNEGQPVNLFEEGQRNPKIEEMLSIIDQVEGKIIIFYHFQYSVTLIRNALKRAGINASYLTSGLNDADVEERKRAFNEDDDVKVVVCQTASMKYGHTLLGTKKEPCYTTLFYENSYDFEARSQAEDRNHRHGQSYPVTYIDIATSREDTKIIKALQRKEGLQEAILTEFKSKPIWN
jgi:SNF2 family DNA or RNA helicase